MTLLAAAVFICFYKREWFVKTARAGAAALLCAVALSLFVLPPGRRLYAAPVVGVLMGLVCVSILIPYVYIMNNTEKYYGMLFGFVGVNLFPLLSQPGWIDSLGERVMSMLILTGAMSLVLFFKKTDLTQENTAPPERRANKVSYLSLAINCSFAIFVKGVGKIILDGAAATAQTDVYLWYFIGGLAGCAVCFFIFACVRGSLYTTWNATFSAFLLAALCYAFYDRYPAAAVLTALFVGISGTMGMLTLYYNMGVIGRKYRSMNHLKLALWFGVLGGGGSVALGKLFGSAPAQSAALILAGVSVAAAVAYFIAFPLLLRTYFAEDWVRDSELAEINELLSEPLKTAHTIPVLAPGWREMLQSNAYDPLSEGELDVAGLVMMGFQSDEIAKELTYSVETVKTYRKRIYSKLQIHTPRELFARAQRMLKDAETEGR
jgi:DNA-binding CsgD family transcriptional regulator